MRRLFGQPKKPVSPPLSLGETTQQIDKKVELVESQLQKCETELSTVVDKLKSAKGGSNAGLFKQRALCILKRKKLLENHRDRLHATQLTLYQAQFNQDSVRTASLTINALEFGNMQFKKELNEWDPNKLEIIKEDLLEFSSKHEDISRAFSLNCSDTINDADLEEEYSALVAETSSNRAINNNNLSLPSVTLEASMAPSPDSYKSFLLPDAVDKLLPKVPAHPVGSLPVSIAKETVCSSTFVHSQDIIFVKQQASQFRLTK